MRNALQFDRRMLLRSSAACGALLAAPGIARGNETCDNGTIINPIIFQRADPQVLRDPQGRYLFTASVPEYDRIVLRRADTIGGLSKAKEKVLWRRPASGRMGGHIWAPEIHRIGGRWFIYFAAGNSDDVFHIRTYVLACAGEDPMTDPWAVLGQVQTEWDTFTLDSTSFNHRGVDYLCWAQHEPGIDTNSNLYIAPLASPTTLAAKPTRLTVPTLEWEIQGFKVNEGPYLLKREDKMFLTYSASATDARYCVGMLTISADADLMDPASWSKSPTPVMTSAPDRCIFGPGHNSFTTDSCGRDVIVFHARDYSEIVGDPLYDPNRHARVQFVRYDERGIPVFNPPVGNGPLHPPTGDA